MNPAAGGFSMRSGILYNFVEVANLLAGIPLIEFIVNERLELYLKKKYLVFGKRIKRRLAEELHKPTIAQW